MTMTSRSVLITGVSSGIGLALVKACLGRGDSVLGLGRNPPPGREGMPGLAFVPGDLADLPAVPSAVARLLAGVNRLDTVILNAGILGPIGDLAETSLEAMKGVMEVNLWANKAVLDALFARLGEEGQVGQVVGISSGASVSGARGWNGYALSKAALNMLMKLYASERPGTHFSALAPGLVDTAMQATVRGLPPDPRFPTLDRLKRAHGTADMPSPEEAAPRLLEAMDAVRKRKSGEFYDLRSLG